jgi:hypothetical protein
MERCYVPAAEACVALGSLYRLELAQALGEDVGAHVRQAGPQVGEALGAQQQLAQPSSYVRMVAKTENLRSGVLIRVHSFVL